MKKIVFINYETNETTVTTDVYTRSKRIPHTKTGIFRICDDWEIALAAHLPADQQLVHESIWVGSELTPFIGKCDEKLRLKTIQSAFLYLDIRCVILQKHTPEGYLASLFVIKGEKPGDFKPSTVIEAQWTDESDTSICLGFLQHLANDCIETEKKRGEA